MAIQRQVMRDNQEWEESDKLRKQINKLGFDIEDKPNGPSIKKRTIN